VGGPQRPPTLWLADKRRRGSLTVSCVRTKIPRNRGSAADEDQGGSVIGVNVSFQYDGSFDRARVTGIAEKERAPFEGMPGLRFKFFTFDEAEARANNFYVWDSTEAANEFFSDEVREMVTDLYGVAPTIEFVEIAQIVDNSGA
jgi:hypothetical protein